MRYLIQFAVPVLIFALVAWGVLGARRRRAQEDQESDGTWAFVAILAIGAMVAVALFMVLGEWLTVG